MTARVLRTVGVTLLAALALLLGATPAFAHDRLAGSDPADGASLDAAPQRVSLTFNQTVAPDFTTLTVVGPDGARYETGAVSAEGPTVSTAVLPLGPVGNYEIGYRVVSSDGHPISGSVAFTLSAPGPGASAASPTTTIAPAAPAANGAATPALPSQSGGMPVWPWVVGAVVLVGGAVFAALRLGRR